MVQPQPNRREYQHYREAGVDLRQLSAPGAATLDPPGVGRRDNMRAGRVSAPACHLRRTGYRYRAARFALPNKWAKKGVGMSEGNTRHGATNTRPAMRWMQSVLAGTALALMAASTGAQEPDATAEGAALWNTAGCFSCHGALALGGGDNSNPFGPNLRVSRKTPEQMAEIIACGTPRGMPMHVVGAFTEYQCYGAALGEAPPDIGGSGVFTPDEIDILVAFLFENVVRKTRITRENCAIFFGGNTNAPLCMQF